MGRRGPIEGQSAVAAEDLIVRIRQSIVGDELVVETPFGDRRVVYADYTASGKPLRFLEDWLTTNVLPYYANTHTESSITGRQITRLREEARAAVHRAVGGDADTLVIFCGSGSTGAINKLVDILGLRLPADLDQRYHLSEHLPERDRPVVFIGPYEHHSNELPWRESIAEVVVIGEDAGGHIDLVDLERQLDRYRDRPRLIGSFSAASNVTGILTDTGSIARLLHRYGALSFWDYAAAAPYVTMDMNPAADEAARKDAIFLSPHKFVGGPGTPGVLAVRREVVGNKVPAVPGGGTVSYVSPLDHEYLTDVVHREEGGTPAIIESIRCGLVFQLKEAVGPAAIGERERDFARRAIASWSRNPAIQVLGSTTADRLPIVSFVVRDGPRYLHHNFVVAVLSDLFGIQARGGCSCAGPYGHRLLGIDMERSRRFEDLILRGYEGIKPGWTRLNFNYFTSADVFDYILEAVHLVAAKGWKLVRDYRFDPATGLWHHRSGSSGDLPSLRDFGRTAEEVLTPATTTSPARAALPLSSYLEQARQVLEAATGGAVTGRDDLPPDFESLRWFTTSAECPIGVAADPDRPR